MSLYARNQLSELQIVLSEYQSNIDKAEQMSKLIQETMDRIRYLGTELIALARKLEGFIPKGAHDHQNELRKAVSKIKDDKGFNRKQLCADMGISEGMMNHFTHRRLVRGKSLTKIETYVAKHAQEGK